MRAHTSMLTVHCPGCDRRDDFMNVPDVFDRLCGCGMFWRWEVKRGIFPIPILSTQAENGGSTTLLENGDNTCASGDSAAPENPAS